VELGDLETRFPIYVSLQLDRDIPVPEDSAEVIAACESFGSSANRYFDSMMGRLLGSFGDRLAVDQLLFTDQRAYLLRSGHRAITAPHLTAHANATVTRAHGWEDLPFAAIQEVIDCLPCQEQIPTRVVDVARLFCSALKESDDSLRRFVFSFVGLEVLAGIGQGLSKKVAQELSSELHGAPIQVLMWPGATEGEAPDRNLLFRFACLAMSLARSDAAADVGAFRELNRARNDLLHESGEEVSADLAERSIRLLRKYLAIVSTAEAEGRL
jgi:hypothetical protein